MSQEERDLLIRMDQKLTNFLERFDVLRNDFDTHTEEDKQQFAVVMRFLWGFSGAATLIMIVLKFVHV